VTPRAPWRGNVSFLTPSFHPVLKSHKAYITGTLKARSNLSNMSFESDRQHLLADTILPPPHSSAASFVSVATITDHKERDASPSPSTTAIPDPAPIVVPTQTPYRGFPSEADYLAALSAWAKEKEYVQFDTALIGWYGQKTKEYYLSQPGLGLRKKAKARKEEKRRATISGESEHGDSAAPASKSHLSGLRWPRRATLGKLTPTTTR
jgi:hypothetical protein